MTPLILAASNNVTPTLLHQQIVRQVSHKYEVQVAPIEAVSLKCGILWQPNLLLFKCDTKLHWLVSQSLDLGLFGLCDTTQVVSTYYRP